jgi:hypothetical protein
VQQGRQDEYRGALAKMSMHLGDNILFKMMYGANKFGITLAMPTDMMHASESGVIKYINKVFVASMPLSVHVKVNLLIEKLFVSNCQFAKTLFSRTNFDGGACSLTMLLSHHWPGMTTVFLVLLLTDGNNIFELLLYVAMIPVVSTDGGTHPIQQTNNIHDHIVNHACWVSITV